jgi:hypothetical protein
MAENNDVLSVSAVINGKDIETGANEFVAKIREMQSASEKATNEMADGFQFVKKVVEELAAVIDASRQKLSALSSSIGVGNTSGQFNELQEQVNSLLSKNTELKAKLEEVTRGLNTQGEAAQQTKTELDNLGNATNKAGSSSAFKEAQEDVKAYESILKRLNTQLESLYEKEERLKKARSRIEDTKPSTAAGQQSKERRLEYNSEDLVETRDKIKNISNAIAETSANLEQSKQRMAQFANEAGNASTKTTALRTQLRNARQAVAELLLSGKQNTAEFGRAVNEANKLQAAFNKVSFAVSGKSLASNSFGMLATGIQGVTGAMTTYMGVAGLFTKDQKKLMEIQTKLQAVMSISMGVQQTLGAAVKISTMFDALKASALAAVNAELAKNTAATAAQTATQSVETAATVAQTGATWGFVTALKAVKLAIKSIPVIGWVLAAISAVVAAATYIYNKMTELTDEEKTMKKVAEDNARAQEALRNEYANSDKEIAKNIVTFETLKNKYEKVKGKSKELDKFLKDNKSQFDGLGVSIKNAADAENLFNKGSDKFIESMKLRIKATALFNIAVQSLQEALIHDRNSKGWEHRLYHYQDYKDPTTGKKTDWKKSDKEVAKEARNAMNGEAALRDAAMRRYNGFMQDYQKLIEDADKLFNEGNFKKNGKEKKNTGKSAAERLAEIRQKISEYLEEIENKHNDRLKEIYNLRNKIITNEGEKELDSIIRQRDQQMAENDKWLQDIAKKTRKLWMFKHINASKSNNESTWEKTDMGKWNLKQWEEYVLKTQPKIKFDYEAMAKVISENAAKSTEDAVNKILDKYYKTQRDRANKIKELKNDIEFLEKQLKTAEGERKIEIQKSLDDAKRQVSDTESYRQEWNDYLSSYGTFLEKRKALEDKFAMESSGLDQSSPIYKKSKKEYEKSLQELTFDQMKKNLDWEAVFGDLSKMTKTMLDDLETKLQSIIKNGKNLSVESIKEITEKLKEVQSARSQYDTFGTSLRKLSDARATKYARQATLEGFTVNGKNIYKAYQEAVAKGDVKQQEELKEQKNSYNKSFGDALKEATESTKEYIKAQYAAAEAQARVSATISGVAKAFKSVKNMLGAFGVKYSDSFNEGFEEFTKGLSEFAESFKDIDITNLGDILSLTNPINDVALAVSAVAGTITGVVHTFEGIGKMLGFGADYSSYNKLKAEYQKISSIWDELISKKTEYINLSYGMEAKNAYDDVMSIVKADEQALRNLIKVRGESGASAGSHSINYRQNSWMTQDNWTNVSRAVGKTISSVQDLQSLTAEELEKVKMSDADFWSKLDAETRDYYNKIISLGDTAEDTLDKLQQQLTATSFDSVYNDFTKLISNMDSSTRDFADNFTSYLKNAVIQTKFGEKYKDMLEEWYDEFAKSNEDGNISVGELNKLQESYMQIVEKARNEAKNLQDIYGWSKSGSSSGSQTTSFTAMSADKGDELNGRFAAIQISNQNILDNLKTHFAQAETSTAEILEIQRTSASHLATIAKNTNELYQMNERLNQIERNTRRL